MKIVCDPSGEYPDVINSFYDLQRFDDDSKEEVLFQGYATSVSDILKKEYEAYKRKIYLNLEAPCAFFTTSNAISSQDFFSDVYTICPYTAEWLNESVLTKTTYHKIPFPIRLKYLNHFSNLSYESKSIDVAYMGTIISDMHNEVVDLIRNYNYMFATLQYDPRATMVSEKCSIKWNVLSQAKISIAINLLYPTKEHIDCIKRYKVWYENRAFWGIDQGIVPQFKPRIIEAAACKVLNLVKRDPWNVIEEWFVPEKEFIYWDTIEDLKNLIYDILFNYKNFWPIVERAYEKVKSYDIDVIYKRIAKL